MSDKPETILLPVDTRARLKGFHKQFKGHTYNFHFTLSGGGFYEVYRNEFTAALIKADPYLKDLIKVD